VLPLPLPLALISSSTCFFTHIVSTDIAQLIECWLGNPKVAGSNLAEEFYFFRLENLDMPLFRFVPLWMQLATPAI
jgi:hypothetical protein